MKKLLSLLFVFVLLLTACGSDDSSDTSSDKTEDTTESTEATKYEGSFENTDEDGIVTVTSVTYTKTGDTYSDVEFNATKDGVDKRDVEQYPLNPDGEGAGTWATQADAVATYIEENGTFPTLDDEGNDTDGVSGATIGLSDFEEAFNNAQEVQ